jgi:hypothetical protein
MLPDEVEIVLQLDGLAERERHRRRAKWVLRWGRDQVEVQREMHPRGCLLR